jgi:hypothetical protein
VVKPSDQPISEDLNADGAWIFVSHSNKDLIQVRRIRNFLEQEGHRPLLFYLRCLEKNDARLPQLIRDEIGARTWFVLCDSQAAKESDWVQEERKIVESMPETSRTYVIVDLAKDLESQLHKLKELSKRATAFISYARRDKEIAQRIYRALVRQDYRAFFDAESVTLGMDWRETINKAIEHAVELGFVLLLLSPDYLNSGECAHERQYAFQILGARKKSNIVPIIIRDGALVRSRLPDDLRDIPYQDFEKTWAGPSVFLDKKIDVLLRDLKTRPII